MEDDDNSTKHGGPVSEKEPLPPWKLNIEDFRISNQDAAHLLSHKRFPFLCLEGGKFPKQNPFFSLFIYLFVY